MRIIDAHHHFWHPARGDYVWMPSEVPDLRFSLQSIFARDIDV